MYLKHNSSKSTCRPCIVLWWCFKQVLALNLSCSILHTKPVQQLKILEQHSSNQSTQNPHPVLHVSFLGALICDASYSPHTRLVVTLITSSPCIVSRWHHKSPVQLYLWMVPFVTNLFSVEMKSLAA